MSSLSKTSLVPFTVFACNVVHMDNLSESHRKIANRIMLISSIYSAVIFLIDAFLPYPCTLPEVLIFSANLSFSLFFWGLYLKSCYRFMWNGSNFAKTKAYVCAILPIIVQVIIVVREIYAPSMIGPDIWLCREFGFGWFYNWRLWWISSIIDQAVTRSVLIIYVAVLVRKIIEKHTSRKVERKDANV